MRFAYADPPYIGYAKEYGREEVDHEILLQSLYKDFPDGWALSASMSSLWDILPMTPKSWKCRIAAWCKPFGTIGAFGRPQYCWEPVIFCGGRKRGRDNPFRDFVVTNSYFASFGHKGTNRHTTKDSYLKGKKPDEFCYWIFGLLNMKPGDEFVDLFPGTGRVTRAWKVYKNAGMELFA